MARTTNPNALTLSVPLLPVIRFNLGDGITRPLILDLLTVDWIKENIVFDGITFEEWAECLAVEKVMLAAKGKREWDKDFDEPYVIDGFLDLEMTVKPRNERIISCSTFVEENEEKLPFLSALDDEQIRTLIETTHPDYIVID